MIKKLKLGTLEKVGLDSTDSQRKYTIWFWFEGDLCPHLKSEVCSCSIGSVDLMCLNDRDKAIEIFKTYENKIGVCLTNETRNVEYD